MIPPIATTPAHDLVAPSQASHAPNIIGVLPPLVRIALVALAIWFAFGFLMFLFDVRDMLQEIVRQWLEAIRERGA